MRNKTNYLSSRTFTKDFSGITENKCVLYRNNCILEEVNHMSGKNDLLMFINLISELYIFD